MILVCLMGGLGNQLFQLALALRLAQIPGNQVALDTSPLYCTEGITPRSYELFRYNHGLPLADTRQRVIVAWDLPILRWIRDGIDGVHSFTERRLMRERFPFHYDEEVLRIRRGRLVGDWQNEGYLGESPLRQRFRAMMDASGDLERGAASRAARLRNQEHPIAVHVRRGDYLTHSTSTYHGSCSVAYYRAAMSYLRSRLPRPHFHLFSDDPSWCAAHLAGEDASVISVPDGDAHVDLALMRLCRHFIIANSTFSWWGAWLGENPGSIIISPDRWTLKDHPSSGAIVPDRWMKLAA